MKTLVSLAWSQESVILSDSIKNLADQFDLLNNIARVFFLKRFTNISLKRHTIILDSQKIHRKLILRYSAMYIILIYIIRKLLPHAEPLGDGKRPSFNVIYNVPLIFSTRLRYENAREFFTLPEWICVTIIKHFFTTLVYYYQKFSSLSIDIVIKGNFHD